MAESSEYLIKGTISYNEGPIGEYNAGSLTGAIADVASSGVNYPNGNPFQLVASTSGNKSESIDAGIWTLDIAQSHHYTVQLQGFKAYHTPEKSFSEFLPVKSIQLNQTSYENMTIPLSIFGDFPLLNRKRVSTISITCFDEDTNIIEKQLRAWEKSCFPSNKYVAYMSDIARKFTYIGYNVKGQRTLGPINMYVIPSGNISVSRDYSANDAKLLTFTLVCVGDGSSCATGRPAQVSDNGKVSKPEVNESPMIGNSAVVPGGVADQVYGATYTSKGDFSWSGVQGEQVVKEIGAKVNNK